MSGSILGRLVNLPAMIGHLWSRRDMRSAHEPEDDLELALYAAIFGNNFLHYGYFKEPPKDPESISLADVKKAMVDYADLILERVPAGATALDLGCGMGGLLEKLDKAGVKASGVTPDKNQVAHITKTWPHIPVHHCKFEEVPDGTTYDVLINSESFQYVDLEKGLAKAQNLMAPGGKWVMTDYFRINPDAHNKSGHPLDKFEEAVARHGFKISERIDITKNTVPTLQYAYVLATRFGLPIGNFASARFFRKHPFFEYLFKPLVQEKLSGVRLRTIDADIFSSDKRYLLLTLERV